MSLTSPSGPELIVLEDVSKFFQTTAGPVPALQGISLDIPRGQFISIIGKSGSGKSTLINMITGIDRPTSGRVLVGGQDLGRLDEGRLSVWRGPNMGVVFQFFQLLPVLTLLENILLPMDLCGCVDAARREERARSLLALVGLADFAGQYPGEISGGQQQSAAIARALANDPAIIVADEPTGNLDSATAETVYAIFEDLVAAGKTIVMVTHDMSLAQRAHRKIIISDGRLVNETIADALPNLPHPLLMRLSQAARPIQIRPGETITAAGQPGPALWFVQAGEARLHDAGHPLTWSPGTCFSSANLRKSQVISAGSTGGFSGLWLPPEALTPLLPELSELAALFSSNGRIETGTPEPTRKKRRFLWW